MASGGIVLEGMIIKCCNETVNISCNKPVCATNTTQIDIELAVRIVEYHSIKRGFQGCAAFFCWIR